MISNRLKPLVAVAAAALLAAPLCAAEKRADGAERADKSEAPVIKKKKGPNKKPEYFRWKDAAAVAEAWEQPVIVFIDLEDSKVCSRVRAATVGNRHFRDFVKDNCVYYRYKVPRVEVRQRGRRNRGRVQKKDDVPKPDFEAVAESERKMVNKILDGNKNSFPRIALVKPNGQVVCSVGVDSQEPAFDAFINELKDAFSKGKCDFTVSKNLRKVLDAEAKKRAALEKRRKK